MEVQMSIEVLANIRDTYALMAENHEGEPSGNIAAAWVAALDAAIDAMSWQPIETAPKDGTDVLVRESESLFPTAARYDSRERFQQDYGDPDYLPEGWRWSFGYPSDFHEELIYPTHWKPIPEPPNTP